MAEKKKTFVIPSERAELSQPSIILAFDWFDERLYRGVFNYAKEAGWHMSPYMISDRFIPKGWPGDGAITCYGPSLKEFIDHLDIPTVDVTIEDMPRKVPQVVVDNEQIGELAAEHFHSRGYTHYAYYAWAEVTVNKVRRESFFKGLIKRGVSPEHLYEIKQSPPEMIGDWHKHEADIFQKISDLPRPLAVFAGQDNLGATLIEICVRNGIHVPEEVAVLGVDNIELLCESAVVPLSSIRTNLTEVGYQAAQQLDRLMRGEITSEEPLKRIPPHSVVRRQSTDSLAVTHPAVVNAIRFIRENFGQPITIEDICEYTGLSKRGLEKAFHKHLSRSPASELRRLRIQNAKRLLTETDDKVEYIALCCGYSNSSNLSCAFKKDTHMSPREYRQKYRHIDDHA
ncbi:MAG: substrate-binding domain-containing protein [Puniceicoccaceae bacterium]